MKQLLKFLLIVLVVSVFIQCDLEEAFTTVIEVEVPEHESKLAIIAHFTTQDSVHRVFVSNSLGILEQPIYDEITDALVELYEADNLLVTFEYEKERKYYESLNTGQLQAGKTYRLEVSHSDYGMVSSEQQLTIAPNINKVEFQEDGGIDEFGYRTDLITIEFEDLDPDNNYFELQFLARQEKVRSSYDWDEEEWIYDTFYLYCPLRPFAENGFMQSGTNGRLFFNNDVFSSKNISLRILDYIPEENPSAEFPIEVYLSSITADRYFYEISLTRNRDAGENPFVEPIILHENIQDGHGIFSLGAMDIWVLE